MEELIAAIILMKRKVVSYWFTVCVKVQRTFSVKEKMKGTTPVW
jgi:hypothetical protein